MISGRTMWRNSWSGPAPSTWATSTTSRSTLWSAASRRIAHSGVIFQTSAMITIHIAVSLFDSHGW